MSRFSAAQNTNLKLKNDLFEEVISGCEHLGCKLTLDYLSWRLSLLFPTSIMTTSEVVLSLSS